MAFKHPNHSLETEYLAQDAASDEKRELHNGEIYAMAGAKRNHVMIAGNVAESFRRQLRGKHCTTFSSDLRVRVPQMTSYYYPDVVVVCGTETIENETDLHNPTLIVEVQSGSTSNVDTDEKTVNYRTILSLQTYLLVSAKNHVITIHTRQNDGWFLRDVVGVHSSIMIDSLGIVLSLEDVYENVMFDRP